MRLTDVSAGLYFAFAIFQLANILVVVLIYEKVQESLLAVICGMAVVFFFIWLFLPQFLAGFGV